MNFAFPFPCRSAYDFLEERGPVMWSYFASFSVLIHPTSFRLFLAWIIWCCSFGHCRNAKIECRSLFAGTKRWNLHHPLSTRCCSNAFSKHTFSNILPNCSLTNSTMGVIKDEFVMTRRFRTSVNLVELANLSTMHIKILLTQSSSTISIKATSSIFLVAAFVLSTWSLKPNISRSYIVSSAIPVTMRLSSTSTAIFFFINFPLLTLLRCPALHHHLFGGFVEQSGPISHCRSNCLFARLRAFKPRSVRHIWSHVSPKPSSLVLQLRLSQWDCRLISRQAGYIRLMQQLIEFSAGDVGLGQERGER